MYFSDEVARARARDGNMRNANEQNVVEPQANVREQAVENRINQIRQVQEVSWEIKLIFITCIKLTHSVY